MPHLALPTMPPSPSSRPSFLTIWSSSSVLPLLDFSFRPPSDFRCSSKGGAMREGVRQRNHQLLIQRDEPEPVTESRKTQTGSSSTKTRVQNFPFHPGEPVPSDNLTHSKDFQALHLLSWWFQEATGLESSGQCLIFILCAELQGN